MNFRSNGKLLITGEYLVLKGADSLAVPLNFQQTIQIEKSDNPGLNWISKEKGNAWFQVTYDTSLFEITETNDEKTAKALAKILKAAIDLNSEFQNKLEKSVVTTNMDFERQWGFGSSSSLISNIAYWAGVDPFELHKKISSGSGYDVVTSRAEGPVVFNRDADKYTLAKAQFLPSFKNDIYFVFLGTKQDSTKSVLEFNQKKKSFRTEVEQISQITRHLKKSQSLEDFEYYIKEHEQIIASVLKQKPIKETILKNFQGEAKSLGAWGGDFAMLTWQYGREKLIKDLEKINLNTVFTFDELIKQW